METKILERVRGDIKFYEEQYEILKEKKHEVKIKGNRQQKMLEDVLDNGFEIADMVDYASQLEEIELDLKLCKSMARRMKNILECYNLM